ncbi:recombinase family protein [Azospirillum sp. B21]|uniref:recombinase family protein n=1 Tax=Azospirillum sp. B21 TaxID=2607496 RepID=UPI0011EF3E65|nr:recombinase family protein [Azospirillum sp. B21]KAA0575743.1 recombinase family protein [Azospirillum sp. B21]
MISGATKARDGYQAMLRAVDAGGADIVFAEALDRLTRDPEESHALFKRLKHRRVRLVTLAEGEVSNIHVAVSGISNALYLEAVAFKTRRSILDKVRKGEIIVGLSYGYRVVKVHAEDGTLVDRQWEIVEEQAAVVRDIFTAFAGGHSPKRIARDLNERGVPGPRGGIWRDTTIRGHHQRTSVYLSRCGTGCNSGCRRSETAQHLLPSATCAPGSTAASISSPALSSAPIRAVSGGLCWRRWSWTPCATG